MGGRTSEKKNVRGKAIKFLETLAGNLFVDRYSCIVCDAELESPRRLKICPECAANMTPNDRGVCRKCGRVQLNEADYCLTCQDVDRYFDTARSSYVYEGKAKSLVYALKFGGAKYKAKYMARAMTDKYLEEEFDCDLVVAVPLSKKRRRKRGYNQAELLARAIARELKLETDFKTLTKVRDNLEQARLSGKEREENVRGAYAATRGALKGKRVLLVDDVLTTGATASEISRILYGSAGAASVKVLTYASTRYKPSFDGETEELSGGD